MPAGGPVVVRHQRRASAGLAISSALHIAGLACALYLVQARPPPTLGPLTPVPPRLVTLVYVPEIPFELPFSRRQLHCQRQKLKS